MTFRNRFYLRSYYLKNGFILGMIAGLLYASLEAYFSEMIILEKFFLIIRGIFNGALIGVSVGLVEIVFYEYYRKQNFLFSAIIRSLLFTFLITFWLTISNSILYLSQLDLSLWHAFEYYINSNTYLYNLLYGFLIAFLMVAMIQISKLHRRNELINFILGKYNNPVEEELIFLFIDLKDSTSIAERLGHKLYGQFLKEYYFDVSDAISSTNGDVYQYVGDEIIIFWKLDKPDKNLNSIRCYQLIQKIIKEKTGYYLKKYGTIPSFRGSIHTGAVVITWVGEVKKEILFIGDALNTGSRIQELCKRKKRDLLISGQILDIVHFPDDLVFPFEDKFILRGKSKEVLVFRIETK